MKIKKTSPLRLWKINFFSEWKICVRETDKNRERGTSKKRKKVVEINQTHFTFFVLIESRDSFFHQMNRQNWMKAFAKLNEIGIDPTARTECTLFNAVIFTWRTSYHLSRIGFIPLNVSAFQSEWRMNPHLMKFLLLQYSILIFKNPKLLSNVR